jgi:hypothetical protein
MRSAILFCLQRTVPARNWLHLGGVYSGGSNMKAFVVLATISVILVVSSPSAAYGAPEQNCLAWERATVGAAGRPVIDRLGDSSPYGQLLKNWLADNCMRLNYVQVLGTHNSYHVQPRPDLLSFIAGIDPNAALSLEYTHRPLDEQMGVLGVRQVELDVYADPHGGLYATPIGAVVFPDPSFPVPMPGLASPGLKVLHTQDVDFKTTCLTFVDCLEIIKAWSDGDPGHLPIMILVEAKDDPLVLPPDVLLQLQQLGLSPVEPVAFGAGELNEIDEEILSVFPSDGIITPDDVRGGRPTLEQAVLKDGWPTLNESRGKVMFALDNTDEVRNLYIDGHSSLAGRVMFTNSAPGTSEAAFVEVNEPRGNVSYIQSLVSAGYLVRTRADEDTLEARLGDTSRRDAALMSGAQFISTDYPEPDPDLSTGYTGYFVEIPGAGAFRCNPVLSPPTCDASGLEMPGD